MRGGKDVTFARLRLIESMRNARTLLDYANMTIYDQFNEKCPRVPLYTFAYSYDSTYEEIFAPACMLGYPIQASL